ncbi:MAG: flagellar biosynthesis protein FlhB [Planctomycetota bacterium]
MADQEKDQKTEEATPRRLAEARENGQVALSQELVAALMLCAAATSMALGGGELAHATGDLAASSLGSLGTLGTTELDIWSSAAIVKRSTSDVMLPLLVLFLPVLVVGVLAGYGQVGFRITPKGVAPDPSKVSPIKGFGRLFSVRSVMRTGMSAAKILAISLVVGGITYTQIDEIARVGDNELGPLLAALGRVALTAVAGGLITIVALALIDLMFQRFQHAKEMRMTKQEVKDEHKTTEGDPKIKAKVRQIQREMATQRMMADVPEATVVVTNPTHYAVALSYDRPQGGDDGAPRCVAKGKGHVARRIKEIAREAGVVLYEDVPLARALHAGVEVGAEIPEELYAAVAEVLAYVYRLEGRMASA